MSTAEAALGRLGRVGVGEHDEGIADRQVSPIARYREKGSKLPLRKAEEPSPSSSCNFVHVFIQGASLRGRLPPPATLAHKEDLHQMRMNEAGREVRGFRCKLATCTCQELHGPRKQSGRRMHGQNRKGGEKSSAQATSHQLSWFVNGCTFL